MATYQETFGANSPCTGCLPAGWTGRWNVPAATVSTHVRADAGALDGVRFEIINGGSSSIRMVSFDAIGTSETVLDIRARIRASDTNNSFGSGIARNAIAVAASGSGAAANGYVFRLFNGASWILSKYIAGARTDIATVAFSHAGNVWYQVHLHVEITAPGTPNIVQGSVWADTGSEPGSFQIDTTDSSITAGGWVGRVTQLFSTSGTATANLDWITVGTAGSAAPDPTATLGAPSITLDVDSATQITATFTPGAAATDHSLYRSTTPGFTPGPATLIASGLGATPSPYADSGLTPATDYYYIPASTDGVTTAFGSQVHAETDGAGTPPTLRLLSLTTTSVKVGIDVDPLVLEARYQYTLATDTLFASPVSDINDAGSGRYDHDFTGLTTGVQLRFRAKAMLAGGWTKWSNVVLATPSAVVVSSKQPWLSPPWAQPISGTYDLQWDMLTGPVTLGISDDDGATFSTVATGLAGAQSLPFDSAAYADGAYLLLLTDTATGLAFPWYVIIDNGASAYVADGQYTNVDVTDPTKFLRVWNPAAWGAFQIIGGTWLCSRTTTSTVWTGGGNDPSGLAPAGWPASRQMEASVHGRIATTGGGGICSRNWLGAELSSIGLILCARGGGNSTEPEQGVFVTLNSGFLGACGNCSNTGNGAGPGTFSVTVSVPGGLGSGVYSAAVPAWIIAAGPGCKLRMCDFYYIRAKVSMPDPVTMPNVIRVQAMYVGPDAVYPSGSLWQIDETFTLLDNLDAPVNWECGYAAYASSHQPGGLGGSDAGIQDLRQLTAIIEDDECGAVPLPDDEILEPPPFFPGGQPCYLYATVYDDDRVTPLWQVSTDPDHPRPYMLDTGSTTLYGAQEIDPIEGRASIAEVTIGVIDPATIPGDQDSGWLTARLKGLRGRRVRVERGISLAIGTVVIADGPAGSPRMA